MARVVAVAFEPLGRLYYFDAANLELSFGQRVLVPTGDGVEVALCVWGPVEQDWPDTLEACLGPAGEADLARDADNRVRRAEITTVARALIARHELAMRIVGVDFVDQSKDFDRQAVIYFEAPGRVDFRALLIDLAKSLRSRIDLRQIGSRDAAAIVGGYGTCGREFCCVTVAPAREPLSLRVARSQALPNNPAQLVGACGRPMCCLTYEEELYTDFQHRAPGLGAVVATPEGTGTVVGHSVPLDSVVVQLGGQRITCPVGRVCCPAAEPQPSSLPT